MTDLNIITLVGRLTKDPEIRGQAGNVLILSVATNKSKKNSNGEWEDSVSFFNITVFGKWNIEVCQAMNKGDKVMISGELEQRAYEKNGEKKTTIGIIARVVEKIDVYKRPTSKPVTHESIDDFSDAPF